MKNNILVAGGAGFIGSNLCERLIRDSDSQVWSIDNYSMGTVENHIEGVEYISGDTKNIENLVDFIPDIIYCLGE